MSDIVATTRAGGETVLANSTVRALGSSLRGDLLTPAHPEYETARRVWNGSVNVRPALIVRCAGVEDIVRAVTLAREHDLAMSVRGGGHNIAGKALCDRGLTIDLSAMRRVRIDPAARIARVEGGALLGDLDRAAQRFGLATTAGVVTHTGVGGLTLGGGVGRLARLYGLACDNVRAVELVTADGGVLRASPTEHPDLYWGVRGGGGNFGVVAAFEFTLHSVGPHVVGGTVLYPFSHARAALALYRDLSRSAPDALSCDGIFLTSPEGERLFAVSACYVGSAEEGERRLEPLRRFQPHLREDLSVVTYLELQAAADAFFPPGRRYYWKSHLLREMTDELIEGTVEHFARSPSPQSLLIFQQFGGRIARIDRSATAFWHRDAAWDNFAVSVWTDPAQTATHVAWARDWWSMARRFGVGGEYVNNLGEEGTDRVRAAYGGNYERLTALKSRYDPANLFQLNANIAPSG